MDFVIIVTFGPSLRDAEKLRQIDQLGPCIFRINGAHTAPDHVQAEVDFVRKVLPGASMMLDLPGNKVRIRHLPFPLPLVRGQEIELAADQFNYPPFLEHLKRGDLLLTHDSRYTLEVKQVGRDAVVLEPHHDGTLLPNKSMHLPGLHRHLPFLFDDDHLLIEACLKSSIDYLSLSFVRTAEDIRQVKEIVGKHDSNVELVSKVETQQAVENLGDIFYEVDFINVDRGDLSADVGVLRLPLVQERVIEAAKRANKRIVLATQFLKNMETHPVPLIAEIADLYKTIKSGINGVQLSEETAVGRYPVECVQTVFQMFRTSFSSV